MVIILVQVIFFCHLQFECIIGAFKDLIEIIGLAIFRGLKIGAGTKDCKQDYYEGKWFHEGGEITIFRQETKIGGFRAVLTAAFVKIYA
jgi:hypothetical protein